MFSKNRKYKGTDRISELISKSIFDISLTAPNLAFQLQAMILVTGATGLVGTHLLIALIKQENQVRALYRSDKSKERCRAVFLRLSSPETNQVEAKKAFDEIQWYKGTLNDVPALRNAFEHINYVYHCAALISFDTEDFDRMRKVNIEGTANIVNCCLEKKVKKLCHMSSIAALGEPNQNGFHSETSEWNPEAKNSVYAITKYGAELEVWRGIQEGLSAVIVNPGVIIGEGFYRQGSGRLFSKVQNGLAFYTAGGSGFVGIKDVIQIMLRLMNEAYENQRYVVVSENIRYKQVLSAIAKGLSKKAPSKKIGNLALNALAVVQWIGNKLIGFPKNRMNRQQIGSLQTMSQYSNQKIVNELQYTFTALSENIIKTSIDFKAS